MIVDDEEPTGFSEYYKDSKRVTEKTIHGIDKGPASKLGKTEIQIIAEFSASFDVDTWAADQGWVIDVLIEGGISLKTLNLWHNQITDLSVPLIAKAFKSGMQLQRLQLQNTDIDYKGVRALAEAIQSGISLKTLVLINCGIRDKGAYLLARALKSGSSLECLDIGFN